MVIPRPRLTSPQRDSRELFYPEDYPEDDIEEDVYHNMQDLFLEHLDEALQKLDQIDEEIWAKAIILEDKRRVAKAYMRHPILTINGSDQEFNGFRIGLCSFDNPMRNAKTQDARKKVHQGVDIKRMKYGAITIKRLCKSNVFVRGLSTYRDNNNCIGSEITRNTQGALEYRKSGHLFDRNKFQEYLMSNRPAQEQHPCLSAFEYRCLSTFSAIVFVHSETDLLRCPLWVLFINIEGLRALIRRAPIFTAPRPHNPYVNLQQQQVLGKSKSKENNNNRLAYPKLDKPPKLPPPRRNGGPDSFEEFDPRTPMMVKSMKNSNVPMLVRKSDDPYYNGIYARVSNFVKLANNQNSSNARNANEDSIYVYRSRIQHNARNDARTMSRFWQQYHPRYEEIPTSFESYEDDEDVKVKIHSRIYGHVPIPTRMILPRSLANRYPDEWDRSANINDKMIRRGMNV